MLQNQENQGRKTGRGGERQMEKLKLSLEKRRALDFLFAAICLELLREINSPRHTDQYSLNPHLIWWEFPPISPSIPPPPSHPHTLHFYFPSPLVFSNHFWVLAWQPFFMLLVRAGDTEGNDVSWCKQRKCLCVCVRVGKEGEWWIRCIGRTPVPPSGAPWRWRDRLAA